MEVVEIITPRLRDGVTDNQFLAADVIDGSSTDSHFKRARLSVGEPIGRVKPPFAVATGCSARLSGHLRAGANAEMAARGPAVASTSPPGVAHRRAAAVVATS